MEGTLGRATHAPFTGVCGIRSSALFQISLIRKYTRVVERGDRGASGTVSGHAGREDNTLNAERAWSTPQRASWREPASSLVGGEGNRVGNHNRNHRGMGARSLSTGGRRRSGAS